MYQTICKIRVTNVRNLCLLLRNEPLQSYKVSNPMCTANITIFTRSLMEKTSERGTVEQFALGDVIQFCLIRKKSQQSCVNSFLL